MAGVMKASLAGVAGSPRPVMVVVSTGDLGQGDCPDSIACSQSFRSAVEAARAAGVTVISAGAIGSPASTVAFGTGGAPVAIVQPSQRPVLFQALDSLAVGGLPHVRVQPELDAGAPGVFVKGRRALGSLTVRIGADTQLSLWYLTTIPI